MKFLLARYIYTHEIFGIGSIGDVKKGTSWLNKFYALPNAYDIKFSTNKTILFVRTGRKIQKWYFDFWLPSLFFFISIINEGIPAKNNRTKYFH